MGTIAPLPEKSSLLEIPVPGQDCRHHHLQFYTADADALISNVSDYLCEGLDRGEGVLVIAAAEHRLAFQRKMATRYLADPDPGRGGLDRAKDTGQLLLADAQNLLSRLMVDNKLDWPRFQRIVGETLDLVRPRKAGLPLRAYGEMVGLLWSAGEYAAAARLEDFWNSLLRARRFQLFCAYPIDVFGAEFHNPAVAPVLQSHTRLISTGNDAAVQAAVGRAAGGIFESWDETRQIGSFRADIPQGEAKILWLRDNLPDLADDILATARQHYRNEKRFRALVENSSDAIALLDPRGASCMRARPPRASWVMRPRKSPAGTAPISFMPGIASMSAGP